MTFISSVTSYRVPGKDDLISPDLGETNPIMVKNVESETVAKKKWTDENKQSQRSEHFATRYTFFLFIRSRFFGQPGLFSILEQFRG